MYQVKYQTFYGCNFEIGNLLGKIVSELIENSELIKSTIFLKYHKINKNNEKYSFRYYTEGMFYLVYEYYKKKLPKIIKINLENSETRLIKFFSNVYIQNWIIKNVFPGFIFRNIQQNSNNIEFIFENKYSGNFRNPEMKNIEDKSRFILTDNELSENTLYDHMIEWKDLDYYKQNKLEIDNEYFGFFDRNVTRNW